MTGGLVQEQTFLILTTPTPIVTFIVTFLAILVSFTSKLQLLTDS